MILAKDSLYDVKQDTFFLDSQIPVPGDSISINAPGFQDFLFLKITSDSFIVDWQLQETEQPDIDKSRSLF